MAGGPAAAAHPRVAASSHWGIPACVLHTPSGLTPASVDFPLQYLRPLYRSLFTRGGPEGKQLALDTFAAASDGYHPIAKKMVGADLGL
jgi:hypothetical protein